MTKSICFPYSWYIDEEETEVTSIRIYGLDEENKNVCLRVDNFHPYIYIELPYHKWNTNNISGVISKIKGLINYKMHPISINLCWKKKLYGSYISESTGERKLFPYLFLSFANRKHIKMLEYALKKKIYLNQFGQVILKVFESDADPILQMTCCRNISTASWFSYSGKVVNNDKKITLCDIEYKVNWKQLNPISKTFIPKPKIMGFDIEVNSTNPTRMPNAGVSGDKIFQISCVFGREGDKDENYVKYLLSLGNPDQSTTGKDVIIRCFRNEDFLLQGFTDLIREENPNIIVGYNILGFDIPYMIARAKKSGCINEFNQQGFHKENHAREKIIKWSSSAYKNQEFEFLDAEGRLYVDLLPLVRRDFKFNNYKLKTISEYFIGQTKDPLSVKGIFKCYRMGIVKQEDGTYSKNSQKAMGICGKYCVQDSVLVVKLVDKLKTWVGLTEMASCCNVPIFSLYTQGQQIKVFSQLYKYCMYNNIVIGKDYETKENERYVGAKVFPPVPGKYSMVVPFDFASLYPTTIIAYNICYHTWVPPGVDIPDKKCHVMKWEDHIGCEHDPKVIRRIKLSNYINKEKEKIKKMREKRNRITRKYHKDLLMSQINEETEKLKPYIEERSEIVKTLPKHTMCEKRKYKFLKEPKGVMPTVIQNLLDARKHTRKVDMVACYKEIDRLKKDSEENGTDNTELINYQKSILDILDKRQLAYKVSANSMYGAMGVRRGYLPFMPGAMCTTYMGRTNIEIVAKVIPEQYGGNLIYGDTDSNYIHFPQFKTAEDTWDHALHVASEVSKLFPKPIELEFEQEIYSFFFILSKKRYMYRKCLRDGVVDDKIGKKGVLLARRDNSKFVRDIYESVITKIADNVNREDILYYIITQLNELCSCSKPIQDFIITKAVGDHGNLIAETFKDEKGIEKLKVGDYTVSKLPKDENEYEEKLKRKGATTEKEYYLLSLPAQVQLAEKMRKRGMRVDKGTRLEYVVTDPANHTGKQYEKIESSDYISKHGEIIKIDYLYYIKALVNPLDQVLDVAFGNEPDFKKGFVMNQYNFRYKIHTKNINKIKEIFSPKINCI